ncbi:MAG: arylesterase [Pseudomonadota bacterium]
MRLSMVRSYGVGPGLVEGPKSMFSVIMAAFLAGIWLTMADPTPAQAQTSPIKMAVLGDSLTAGYGLPASAAFPIRLQKALKDKGIDTDIVNAGVSGDTTSGGRDRVDWSIPDGTEAVIVELGANDALRGIDPKVTRASLDDIIRKLKARNIAVMLAGMYAPRNFGPEYAAAFDAIYPDLAKAWNIPLYPFFLDGVASEAKLNQPDGIHPTAEGVDVIVTRILPSVEAFLAARGEQRK